MKNEKLAAILVAMLLLYSAGAAAQLSYVDPVTNQGILDQVVTAFGTRAAAWQSAVMSAASWLFWTLGTISFTWTMGMLALKKADIGDFFTEFIRFTLFFGFFYWLLQNGPSFAHTITDSMMTIGSRASTAAGSSGVLTPSGIVNTGFAIWKQAVFNLSLWSPVDSFVGLILSTGILLLLTVVAVNMLLLLVSAWILMYAGIFFLGFGGSRWTSDMAINYFKTVLGVAVQLFAMILLVGIGTDLLATFYVKMNKGTLNFEELGVMLAFCLALLLLVSKIPPLLAGVITGGGGGASSGIGGFSVGAAAGAAVTAASMGGAAIAAGATGMVGGAQAVMAAFSKANASESAGGGSSKDFMAAASGGDSDSGVGGSGRGSALAAAMGDSGGGSSDGGSFGGSSSSDSGSDAKKSGGNGGGAPGEQKAGGMASAAAKVGRVAAGTAANLAQGSWDVAKAKAGEVKEAALARIGETTGGKIATAIKASSNQEPAFSGDSLGAGSGGGNANDEVAAFANRTNGGGGGGEENDTSTASGTSGKQSGTTTASTKSFFD